MPKASVECTVYVNRMDTNPCYVASVGDSSTGISEHSYQSEREACKKLGQKLSEYAQLHQKAENNHKRTIIVTNDTEGIVLVIAYKYGSWGYDIVRKGQFCGGSCSSSCKTIEEQLLQARKHAVESYGGISWEGSF